MKKLNAAFLALLLLSALLPSSISAATDSDFWDEPGVRLLNQPIGEYKARRAKLLSQIKDGVVVVLGNVEEDSGIEMRYRQNNWFAYLTGVRTPDAAVMLVPQGLPSLKGAREIVFIPPRDLDAERWTGVQLAPGAETAKAFGTEQVLANSDLWLRLKEAAALPAFKNTQGQSTMKLYTIAPRGVSNGRVREYEFVQQAKKELPGVEVVSVVNIAGEMRRIKSPAEIALLQKAIDITGEAQRDIALNLVPGMYEYEVQALLEVFFNVKGS